MARIDVPTLQCDRCKWTTTDTAAMQYFHKIGWYEGDSGNRRVDLDLCRECWLSFSERFMSNLETTPTPVAS